MLDICNGAGRRGVKGAHGFVSATWGKLCDVLKDVSSAEVMGAFSDFRATVGLSISSGEEKAGLRIGGSMLTGGTAGHELCLYGHAEDWALRS